MSKPIAVLISDIHFSVNTLDLASKSLHAAIFKARALHIPLIICGDTNDSKAVIRAEVANELIDILRDWDDLSVYMLVGNHDLINEKGKEHGLNFLKPYVNIIDKPIMLDKPKLMLLPYYSDSAELKLQLAEIPSGTTIIMHQGFLGASMGDYVQDRSSIDPKLVKDFRVYSGHYHRHQTIGTVTYVGNPYTLSYGEANDGPKGYLVIYDNGMFVREILQFRQHVKISCRYNDVLHTVRMQCEDLVWLTVTGPTDELIKLDKDKIGKQLLGHSDFKLDLVPDTMEYKTTGTSYCTNEELLDSIIDSGPENDSEQLKALWRSLL